MTEMPLIPVEHCSADPGKYKFCSEDLCVSVESNCPCSVDEFQCYLGECISKLDTCDGLPHCKYGEDESNAACPDRITVDQRMSNIEHNPDYGSSDGMSLPVIVIISSVGVFAFLLMIILIAIFITKRQKNNTSRESQSASEPLRKSYITTFTEPESRPPPKRRTAHSNVQSKDRQAYLPVRRSRHEAGGENDHMIEVMEIESSQSSDKDTGNVIVKPNLAIQNGIEIYGADPQNTSRVYGLGKYTFKPRLKYLNSKPYDELEEKDRDKLYVINSYRHCSGKSIIPSSLTFDKDPQQFSDKFATDLLCCSTPRPPLRGLVQTCHPPDTAQENKTETKQNVTRTVEDFT